eukprot:TRINITY_DN669_c0_g3_i3.p4 TRINITY_DN669_c0_g3~~TRINITY_DN669_c0_g3_i3.p4  ORF type:complete len:212 (+),score=71.19 TRINITY_DN669_c0_g3_i3:63-638(+)
MALPGKETRKDAAGLAASPEPRQLSASFLPEPERTPGSRQHSASFLPEPERAGCRVRQAAWAREFRGAEAYLSSVRAPLLFDSLTCAAAAAPPPDFQGAVELFLSELRRRQQPRLPRVRVAKDWEAARAAGVPWLADRMVLHLLRNRPPAERITHSLCAFLEGLPRSLALLDAGPAAVEASVAAAAAVRTL